MSGESVGAEGGDTFGPFDTTFEEGEMRRFLIDIGKDADAYETLRQAEYAEAIRQLDGELKPPQDPNFSIANHIGGMGDIQGALDYGANKGGLLDALSEDAEHNAEVGRKAGIAREIAGLIPTDAASKVVPGAGWALDKGVSSAIDSWEKANLHDHAGAEAYDAATLEEARKQMSKDLVVELLREKGYDLNIIQGASEITENNYASGYDEASKVGNPT